MALSTLQQRILVDMGIICGTILSYNYGIQPLSELLSTQAEQLLQCIRNNDVHVLARLEEICNSVQRFRQRSFVRFIADKVPFLIPYSRYFRWISSHQKGRSLIGHHSDRLLDPFLTFLDKSQDGDEENENEGVIHAFGTVETTGELETSDDLETQIMMPAWGTTEFSMNFESEPQFPECSTPKLNKQCVYPNTSTSQAQAVTDAKVAALENEILEMRAMISKFLAQKSPVISCVPPPPPPPPPFLPSATSNTLKLRCGKNMEKTESSVDKNEDEMKAEPLTLFDVLKALPSVKLRSIAKSPGGTPLKQLKKETNSNDPTALITAALKRRFEKMHSPVSTKGTTDNSYSEDDDYSNKENISQNLNDDDLLDQSPKKPKFRPLSLFKETQFCEKNNNIHLQ